LREKLKPAKDLYHDVVIQALTADGWTITDDPFRLKYGDRKLYVDLGAERETIAAEKQNEKIAAEIKSFLGQSAVDDLEDAVGQYSIYRAILEETEPDRLLYLAVPERVWDEVLNDKFGRLIVRSQRLFLVVFDEQKARIVRWIKPQDIEK
jgi:hypothetical protein